MPIRVSFFQNGNLYRRLSLRLLFSTAAFEGAQSWEKRSEPGSGRGSKAPSSCPVCTSFRVPMNDVLPAEVLELQRRMGGAPGQRPAGTWALPADPKPSAPPAMLALSPESALGSDDFPRGLSPVNSSSSLDSSSPVSSPGPPHAVAIYCQFVGGGLQGSVDLCASVTLVDECGHVLLDTLVKPSIPVTDYGHGDTGLTAEDLAQGMPFRKARKIVLGYLRGGASSPTRLECQQGRKVLLVGTSLPRTLNCLMLDYPEDCLREVGAFEDTKAAATENLDQHNVEMAGHILRQFMDYS